MTVDCSSCGRQGVPGTGTSCWVCYGEPHQDPEWVDAEERQREQEREPDYNDEERQREIEREGTQNDLAEDRRHR